MRIILLTNATGRPNVIVLKAEDLHKLHLCLLSSLGLSIGGGNFGEYFGARWPEKTQFMSVSFGVQGNTNLVDVRLVQTACSFPLFDFPGLIDGGKTNWRWFSGINASQKLNSSWTFCTPATTTSKRRYDVYTWGDKVCKTSETQICSFTSPQDLTNCWQFAWSVLRSSVNCTFYGMIHLSWCVCWRKRIG